jgi:hypothetical protein
MLLLFYVMENLSQPPWMVSPYTILCFIVFGMILFTLWCSEMTHKILNTGVLLVQILCVLHILDLQYSFLLLHQLRVNFWVWHSMLLLTILLLFFYSQIMWDGVKDSTYLHSNQVTSSVGSIYIHKLTHRAFWVFRSVGLYKPLTL